MKNKKYFIIFIILFLIILIGGYYILRIVKNKKEENILQDYTPEQEITEEQNRQTIVSLYFISKETKELEPEARLIDIKEIINDPCDKLIKLLIEGPKNEKQERLIPENTKLLKSYMEQDCVTLDFSAEFLNYDKTNEKTKENIINSIVETLTQLTEVNKVKILINGEQNAKFSETYERKNNA